MDERREAPRCVDIPIVIHQCIVTQLGRETWLSAKAVDFSAKGVCLVLSDSLNSGESLYLLASIEPVGKPPRELSVNGVTTYCRPMDDGRWRVGLQFLDLSESEKEEWTEYALC